MLLYDTVTFFWLSKSKYVLGQFFCFMLIFGVMSCINFSTLTTYQSFYENRSQCQTYFRPWTWRDTIRIVIIPLRPYLEKIKGMPKNGYISYPAVSASYAHFISNGCALNVDACVSPSVFHLTRCHTRVLSAQQRRVWVCYFCLFVCLLSTHFVGSNHVILQFKSSKGF